jgi:hypothetical protein
MPAMIPVRIETATENNMTGTLIVTRDSLGT